MTVPYYDNAAALIGFAVDEDISDDQVLDLQLAVREAMPTLTGLDLQEAPRLVQFDHAGLRIDGRTFRGQEDQVPFEASLTEHAFRLLGPMARPVYWVDRIYCFAWDDFTRSNHDELMPRYRRTLGWREAPDLPRWFGLDDDAVPNLSGSLEVVGLQVTGKLERGLFEAWHASFVAAMTGLPIRDERF